MNKVLPVKRPWKSPDVQQQIGLAMLYIGLAGLHVSWQSGMDSSGYVSKLLFVVCSMCFVMCIGGGIIRDMIRAEEKRINYLKQRLIVRISCAIVMISMHAYIWLFLIHGTS